MIDFLKVVREFLKGEVEFKLGEGLIEYRGHRIIAMPGAMLSRMIEELEKLVGDAASIIMESLGEAAGKATRDVMTWKNGNDTLREFPQLAKVAGFGLIKVHGDEMLIKNSPVEMSPQMLRYISGYLRGICIDVLDISMEEDLIKAKIKIREVCE